MSGADKRFTPQELGAYGVGLVVTVISAVVTGPVIPIPFNFLISFGLGGTAMYGARKLLDPRTPDDIEREHIQRDYRGMLNEMDEIGKRVAQASQRWCVRGDVSARLAYIVNAIEKILQRYRQHHDFAGVSSTLIVLKKFDQILSHYVKVKCDELFLDRAEARRVIAEFEERILPMIEQALESLGRKMDSGESLGRDIDKGTLEDMLNSLGLIQAMKDRTGDSPTREATDDT